MLSISDVRILIGSSAPIRRSMGDFERIVMNPVLLTVGYRRLEQDLLFGGAEHDDAKTRAEWVALIVDHARASLADADSRRFEHQLMDVAALAVAAMESARRLDPSLCGAQPPSIWQDLRRRLGRAWRTSKVAVIGLMVVVYWVVVETILRPSFLGPLIVSGVALAVLFYAKRREGRLVPARRVVDTSVEGDREGLGRG